MKWTIHRLTVSQEDAGLRLDQYLAQEDVLSRTVAKKLIDLGSVHVNGRRLRNCSTLTAADDRIEVYVDHFPLSPYRISAEDVQFQDQYIIVLNKPANVDTQPTHARYKGTLYEALLTYLQNPFRKHHRPDIGMVQRLDRGTSGLIVFSIHPRAHKPMSRIFMEHRLEKRYLALVHNAPETSKGEIVSSLARSRKDNRVRSVARGGKEAITRYRVKEVFDGVALIELELVTGRSHQIRAHMAEQGCPLVGDVRYGGSEDVNAFRFNRPLLHSSRLTFKHPVNSEELDFSLPLPEDMNRFLRSLD